MYGVSKIKYEELGCMGGQYVGLFYLDRKDEFLSLRTEFKDMIEREELGINEPEVEEEKPILQLCESCIVNRVFSTKRIIQTLMIMKISQY